MAGGGGGGGGLADGQEPRLPHARGGWCATLHTACRAATAIAAHHCGPVLPHPALACCGAVTESYQLSFDTYQKQYTEDAGGAMLDRDSIAAVPGVKVGP